MVGGLGLSRAVQGSELSDLDPRLLSRARAAPARTVLARTRSGPTSRQRRSTMAGRESSAFRLARRSHFRRPARSRKPCRKRSVRSKKPFARSWAAFRRAGQGAIMRLGEGKSSPRVVIPSGSLALDEALGVGGYPRGRIVEVYGPELERKDDAHTARHRRDPQPRVVAAFAMPSTAFDLRWRQRTSASISTSCSSLSRTAASRRSTSRRCSRAPVRWISSWSTPSPHWFHAP